MKQINFLGIGLNPITFNEIFSEIDHWITNKAGRSHHIALMNAYTVTLTLNNERLKQIYNAADIVAPDGMPFVKWMRKFNKETCDHIAGPDAILKLAEHSKETGYSFYLYGGAPEVCVGMKNYLTERYPHIRIVGHYSPPFRELTPEEDKAIVDEINSLAPDIICVGLGTPKQDYWIDEHLYKIKGSVMINTGAAFDFFGGRVKRAPEFIRESGFEWLYRLFGKDFKRLWKRYTVMHWKFVYNFFLQKVGIVSYPLEHIEKHHDLAA